jgi:hypothetical protein
MAAAFRSLLRPFNRQVRQHVVDVTTPRLDDLSGQIEDVRLATVEIRRIVTDDLDASNEVAALIGKALADLSAAVDELRAEVAELKSRLG